jgi:P27 family predicted phage terminase small subunit
MHKPPKHLSAESRALRQRLVTEYDIADSGGLLLLDTALEALDRMRDAQVVIKREGIMITDSKTGKCRAHPALIIEKDSRWALLQALKSLNLDIDLTAKVGKPAKVTR